MSVQRIDIDASHTHGWQARVYTVAPQYLSRFFSDKRCGGKRKARLQAKLAEIELERQARRVRASSRRRR